MTGLTRFSLSVIASVGLCVASLNAEPSVRLDSLYGKAEIQRAGHTSWESAKPGEALYNNDVIRVMASADARLKWDDNSVVYIHSNSQISINIFQDPQKELLSRHITVFYGALYFIIKKTIPKAATGWSDLKVYTPTSVIGIRGTAFTVDVDKKSGKTAIGVLSGTVLVRNIIRNTSLFVGTSTKSIVEMNADPLAPKVIDDNDIAFLKTWVPAADVDAAMTEAAQSRSKPRELVTAKTNRGIIILKFTNASSYNGNWNIGTALAQELAIKLKKASPDLIVSDKDTTVENPVDYGSKNSLRYVITGDVMEFNLLQQAAVPPTADAYNEKSTATVKLKIQIIDIPGNKILYEDLFGGRFADSDNTWKTLGNVQFNLNDSAFLVTSLGRATESALNRTVKGIGSYLKND